MTRINRPPARTTSFRFGVADLDEWSAHAAAQEVSLTSWIRDACRAAVASSAREMSAREVDARQLVFDLLALGQEANPKPDASAILASVTDRRKRPGKPRFSRRARPV